MQDREKRLVAEGYPERHTSTGSKVYGRLIKIFTERAEATEEFKKRKNQFLVGLSTKGAQRPPSPTLFHKKIVKKDNET